MSGVGPDEKSENQNCACLPRDGFINYSNNVSCEFDKFRVDTHFLKLLLHRSPR